MIRPPRRPATRRAGDRTGLTCGFLHGIAALSALGALSACSSVGPAEEPGEAAAETSGVAAGASGVAGGASDAGAAPFEIVIDSGQVLLSDAIVDFSTPAAIDVDGGGNLWIADRRLNHVLVVSPDGEVLRTVGRNGEGPGEFRAPRGLGVRGERAYVLDNIHGVQAFDMTGEYVGEYATPRIVFDFDFSGDGGVVASSSRVWMRGGLVAALGPDGADRGLIGEPPFADLEDFNLGALREQLLQGTIPDALRNGALPVTAPDGSLWVVLHTEAVVRRYGADGSLLHETPIDVSELAGIEQRYYEDFRAVPGGDVFFYPSFVADGFATDDYLLLLWDTVEGDPGLVTVHDDTGGIAQRWSLPGLDMGGGGFTVLAMAVDASRRRLYVSVSEIATVFRFDLPDSAVF